MPRSPADSLDFDPSFIQFGKELKRSEASSIFEIELHGSLFALKVVSDCQQGFIRITLTSQYHDNGDPGFTKNGRDLNRFRCEFNAYENLSLFGVCERGLVPQYYGHIDRLDPASFRPHLDHFADDMLNPRAILLEYLQGTEELNCVNFSDDRFQTAIHGLGEIHGALVHHHDVYPKNILIVHEPIERVVWIDFDVAMTFLVKESMGSQAEEYFKYEMELAKSFGDLLVC